MYAYCRQVVQVSLGRIVSGDSDCDNGGGGHGVKWVRNVGAEFPKSNFGDSSSDSEDEEGVDRELWP